VLRDINLTVAEGEFVALMGPCGSGKTTLLNLIGALDGPTAGKIEVAGERIDRLTGQRLARWRSRNIGFVFQFHKLLPVLDVVHNVELPLLLTSLSRAQRMTRVTAALAAVGLQERAHHQRSELSAGEARRAAVAVALVADPRLLVCDDPTRDLDRTCADRIMSLLQRVNREQGKTIVMSTRHPNAADYANRTLYLSQGELAPSADVSSLLSPIVRRARAL